MTSFQSPDTRFIPASRVDLEACIHISETLFTLVYYRSRGEESAFAYVFEGSGPEGPDQWSKHFRISWRTPDTLEVAYDQTIQVTHKTDHAPGLHIIFSRF